MPDTTKNTAKRNINVKKEKLETKRFERVEKDNTVPCKFSILLYPIKNISKTIDITKEIPTHFAISNFFNTLYPPISFIFYIIIYSAKKSTKYKTSRLTATKCS